MFFKQHKKRPEVSIEKIYSPKKNKPTENRIRYIADFNTHNPPIKKIALHHINYLATLKKNSLTKQDIQ